MVTYFIIGADGIEFGPVTAEQIVNWIAQGRLSGESPIRTADRAELSKLREFPEFAAALASGPRNFSGVPPVGGEGYSDPGWRTSILYQEYYLEIGTLASRGWELLKARPGIWVGGVLVLIAIVLGAQFVPILGLFASFIMLGPLLAGTAKVGLNQLRGRAIDLETFFGGFNQDFWKFCGAGMIWQIGFALGVSCLIIPGIYLFTIWLWAIPLILDKGVGMIDALELSRKMVQKHFFQNLLLVMVLFGLVAVGLLFFMIGALVTVPLAILTYAAGYQEIFGRTEKATVTTT